MSEKFCGYLISSTGSIEDLNLIQRDFPELSPSHILVKMECSTINPIDYLSILGKYPVPFLPYLPGIEGSGTVVKSGGSDLANSLLNKRVAVLTLGAWSEYAVAESSLAFPLLDSVSFEQAAGLVINPMTVAYMIDIVKSQNKTFVQNAASSSLGKQLSQWATRLGIAHINLVRRAEHVETLKALGVEHVFNTSEEGWLEKAKKVAQEIKPAVGFDAIGGKGTKVLAELLEDFGEVYNYGFLSGKDPRLSSIQLIFQHKRLKGLTIMAFLNGKDQEGKYELGKLIQENIDFLGGKFNQETDLNRLKDGLENYMNQPTNNKVLVRTKV